jgi:hypothetical protein
MALHLEMFLAGGSNALIFDIHSGSMGNLLAVGSMSSGSLLAVTPVTRRRRNVRTRTVVVGLASIVALALVTGSVLLIAYAAAAASLLTALTMLLKKAIRGRSTAPLESFVPRWEDAEDREAA